MADAPAAGREDERAMIADWGENERAAYRCGRADEREECAQLVESQKELRSSSWHASRIRARGTT